MIQIRNITKTFDGTVALNNLSFDIPSGSVFGLAGPNGAGKSTLFRLINGIFIPDSGDILIEDEKVYNNTKIRDICFFVPDFPYYGSVSTIENTASLLRRIYSNWDENYYSDLCNLFSIDKKQRIMLMSKGMQRQASLILALSTRPKYLFLDEIFDGLDPFIRQSVKELFLSNVKENGMSVVIASHNLKELEEICEDFAIIKNGNLITGGNLNQIKSGCTKLRIAFSDQKDESIFSDFDLIKCSKEGNMFTLLLKNGSDDLIKRLEQKFGAQSPPSARRG